jgi:hypothetical protein
MAKSRSTFGKMQREQDKRNKAREKQERREARKDEEAPPAPTTGPVDESKVLMELAKIHEDLAEGRLSLEDFEVRQEELRELLMMG